MTHNKRKPLIFIGSAREDIRSFPNEVKSEAGYALYEAQRGGKHKSAIPFAGFGDAKVLEVALNNDGSTYRAIYTVRFGATVYVLHAFQKKSNKGKATPNSHLALIRKRLKVAETLHKESLKKTGKTESHAQSKQKSKRTRVRSR